MLRSLRTVRLSRAASTFSYTAPKTQLTTLKNGLTVASEQVPGAKAATVGVWIDAGSRAENEFNNGTAHFLEHLSFKGTEKRSQHDIELEIENMGGHLNAYTSRENTVFYAKALKEDVPKTVDILSDILTGSKLEESAVNRERDVILREAEEIEKMYDEALFDHLHSVAFQNQPLGRTILGPKRNIQEITGRELRDYIKKNYHGNRMVLVGVGAVEHENLVKLAEQHFGKLEAGNANYLPGRGSIEEGDKSQFVGSEVRIRDDTLPAAHIALAVEGVSWDSKDYYPALVAQAVIGSWDRAQGTANNQGSKLAGIVASNHLANSFMSFSTSYADTGLWGIYLVTEAKTHIADLVHFTLKQWNRLSTHVTQAEVERAKAQLKASLLLTLDGTTAQAEDIGRQLVTTGRYQNAQEVERAIDAVTLKDVTNFADTYLWDRDLSIAAMGPIGDLPDYLRIRNDMSSMRY